MDTLITGVLAFLGAALLSYEANYIIRSIQDKRQPKRVPINPKIFETYKHRQKHDDENTDGENK